MNKYDVVVVCGIKESGKSTVANYLSQEFGYCPIKLADPIKRFLEDFLVSFRGTSPMMVKEYTEGALKETPTRLLWNMSPRVFMQKFGTEFMRDMVYKDAWADVAYERIKSQLSSKAQIVIDDIRYPNEVRMAEEFRSYGYKVKKVWVTKAGNKNKDEHASENSISHHNCDIVIHNDGTKEELFTKVRRELGLTLDRTL